MTLYTAQNPYMAGLAMYGFCTFCYLATSLSHKVANTGYFSVCGIRELRPNSRFPFTLYYPPLPSTLYNVLKNQLSMYTMYTVE
jgi:hypothetical protein